MHTLGVILISLAIIFALIGAAFAAVYLLLEWRRTGDPADLGTALCVVIFFLLLCGGTALSTAKAHNFADLWYDLSPEQQIRAYQLPEWWQILCWGRTDCWT